MKTKQKPRAAGTFLWRWGGGTWVLEVAGAGVRVGGLDPEPPDP